jgi:hypothetical protein
VSAVLSLLNVINFLSILNLTFCVGAY